MDSFQDSAVNVWKNRHDILRKNQFDTIGKLSISGFNVRIDPPDDIAWHSPDPIEFIVTSVAVITIFNLENQSYTLLLQQGDRKGNPWEYPSGGVDLELDKHPLDTALRELLEETGISASKDNLNPLSYKIKPSNREKGALQYLLELDEIPKNWNILRTDEKGRIYIETPKNVDRNEISEMLLEPVEFINTNESLGVNTHHSWANSVRKPLANQGYPRLEELDPNLLRYLYLEWTSQNIEI